MLLPGPRCCVHPPHPFGLLRCAESCPLVARKQQAESLGYPLPSYESEDVRIQVQRGFLRKVYSILCLQLLCTVGFCWAVMAHPAINAFVLRNSWMSMATFIPTIGLIFGLHLWKNSYPLNMSLLAAFTLCESLMVATVCAHYEAHGVGQLVGIAWGITLFIFTALTLMVMCSRMDFSFMGLFLPPALFAFVIYSCVCWFIGVHTGYTFAFLGAVLFSAFIVYDTHQIMTRLGCDDYIIACIELYLDIINLFLMILDLLGGGAGD